MKLSRRSFFGFAGGAAAAMVLAPKAIIARTVSTPVVEAPVAVHAASNGFLTPEIYAREFLKLLKENMVIGKLVDGQD